jgi:hypothetical protein
MEKKYIVTQSRLEELITNSILLDVLCCLPSTWDNYGDAFEAALEEYNIDNIDKLIHKLIKKYVKGIKEEGNRNDKPKHKAKRISLRSKNR